MRRIISALFFSLAAVPAALAAGPTPPLQLAPDAPERHIVVKGDTLWDISAKFLKDAFRWPELWKLNKDDIKNPHWIYPGQVLVLDRSGGSPFLRPEGTVRLSPQERAEPIQHAIWSIAPDVIEPFLTRPLVLADGVIDDAARIIGLQDYRSVSGTGDKVYAANVREPHRDWQIFRPGAVLLDPETGQPLGFEALYLGTAQQLSEGTPAEFIVRNARQEILVGDRLVPTPKTEIVNYVPHPPPTPIAGAIAGLTGGVGFAGKNSVVSINRGKAHGLEVGHVLALDRAGEVVVDRFKGEKTVYQLPHQRNGVVFVFRVLENVSYALIMEAQRPVVVGDRVHAP